MMRIQECFDAAYAQMPESKTIVKSVLTMAVASVALNAIASLETASAGPIAYAACVAACAGMFPPAALACVAACQPILYAPTP